ncbi:MAG: glycosyltransferase [Myxococcota bacterium]
MESTDYDAIVPIGPGSERHSVVLEGVLHGFARCPRPPAAAIVALNGQVTDAFARAVADTVGRFDFAKLVRLERANRGAARNAAVRAGRSPIVLFCDADTLLSAAAVDAALDVASRGAFGCAAWRRYLPDDLSPEELRRAASDPAWRARIANHRPVRGRGVRPPVPRSGHTMTFISAFGSCPRALFEAVGGFPELDGYGMEDAELMRRLLDRAPFESLVPHEVWHVDHPMSPYRLAQLRHNIAATGRQSGGTIFRYWSLFSRDRVERRCPELLVAPLWPEPRPEPWPRPADAWLPPAVAHGMQAMIETEFNTELAPADTAGLLVHCDAASRQIEVHWVTHTLIHHEQLIFIEDIPVVVRRRGLESLVRTGRPPAIGWSYQVGRVLRASQIRGACDLSTLVHLDAMETLARWRTHLLLDRLGSLALGERCGPLDSPSPIASIVDLVTWITGRFPTRSRSPFFDDPTAARLVHDCMTARSQGPTPLLEILRAPLLDADAMAALPPEGEIYTANGGHGHRVLERWGIDHRVRWRAA